MGNNLHPRMTENRKKYLQLLSSESVLPDEFRMGRAACDCLRLGWAEYLVEDERDPSALRRASKVPVQHRIWTGLVAITKAGKEALEASQ